MQGIKSRCEKLKRLLDNSSLDSCQTGIVQAQAAQLTRGTQSKHDSPRSTLTSAIAAVPVAPASDPVQRLPKQLLSKPAQHQPTYATDATRLSSSHVQPTTLASATQAGQQLQEQLAQYQGMIMGGYTVQADTNQLQVAAPPYQRMLSLKSVLAQRLQANQSTDAASLLQEAGWQSALQQNQQKCVPEAGTNTALHKPADQGPLMHNQAKVHGILRHTQNTQCLKSLGDSLCKGDVRQKQAALQADGSLKVLQQGHQQAIHQEAAPVQHPNNDLGGSHAVIACPPHAQMLAAQDPVPVMTALPLHSKLLNCSGTQSQSLGTHLADLPQVHPYFQVSDIS